MKFMQLNLTKPIAFFDLETTGVNVASDRIVEISILKVMPDGTKETKTKKDYITIRGNGTRCFEIRIDIAIQFFHFHELASFVCGRINIS